ncbi:MAG: D-alanine--D-alanine ligase [Nitrospinae bacterium]|nr:D-alanine--D-alanine ligase [Nitrospinota bacterium]
MKITVLHGVIPPDAPPDEQDTLEQLKGVMNALAALGHEAEPLPFSLDLEAAALELKKRNPEAVFNLVDSVNGSGRLIHLAPSLLDYLGIPYTGSKTEGIFTTSAKLTAKKIMTSAGLPTPSWVAMDNGRNGGAGRYIVKSMWEHASVGLDEDSVFFASGAAEAAGAVAEKTEKNGGEWYAEEYIDGREFNISVIGGAGGPRTFPPAEILFDGYGEGKLKVVGYRAKWVEDSFEYTHTPRSFEFAEKDRPLLERLSKLSLECWRLFGLKGYVRVDFRVDGGGNPWILEVNANPCITTYSGFAAAAGQGGLDYEAMTGKILEDAFVRAYEHHA